MNAIAGVYEIRNTVNGKRYIGSSENIVVRFRLHEYALNNGKHHNPHLQAAWNKYGEASFVFAPLFYCDVELTLIYEQMCLDNLTTEYNIGKNATAAARGRKLSENHKRILALSNKNRVWTEEAKQRLRKAATGNKYGIGHRHTDEILQKRWRAVICLNNGIVYDSIKEAGEALGVDHSKISAVASGKRNHTGGYRFAYVGNDK